jgi:Tol biopolymer transport system component
VATGRGGWAVWLPDGRRVIYQVPPNTDGGAGLFEKPVDGSTPARRLTTSKVWQQPQMVTSDGRFLVYQEAGGLGTRLSEIKLVLNFDKVIRREVAVVVSSRIRHMTGIDRHPSLKFRRLRL